MLKMILVTMAFVLAAYLGISVAQAQTATPTPTATGSPAPGAPRTGHGTMAR